MTKEKPNNHEYSQALEYAKTLRSEVTDTERMIDENQRYLEELKQEKQTTPADNAFAREHGFAEIDITDFDEHIKEVKQAITDLENLKTKLLRLAERAEQLHTRGREFLERDNPPKVN